MSYPRNSVAIWSWFLMHACKMMISCSVFFIFWKCWFYGLLGGEMAKNGLKSQNICLSHSTSQELYIKLSFMVHMREIIIFSGAFFIFSKFWFCGLIGGWKGKKQSKMTKNSACCSHYLRKHTSCDLYLRNHTSCDCHLWCTCVKW